MANRYTKCYSRSLMIRDMHIKPHWGAISSVRMGTIFKKRNEKISVGEGVEKLKLCALLMGT